MKQSEFSEKQIVYAVRQTESGTFIGHDCPQLGIAEQTIYAWKRNYTGLGLSELQRLCEENIKLN